MESSRYMREECKILLEAESTIFSSLQSSEWEECGAPSAGEKTWRLPLEDSYWDIMKSNIADMKNAGNRYAGSITAGLFLKQYVDTEKVEWAHVDIAGCEHRHWLNSIRPLEIQHVWYPIESIWSIN